MADKAPAMASRINADSLRFAYESLLGILQKYEIRATMAFVGMFTLDEGQLRNEIKVLGAEDSHKSWLKHATEAAGRNNLEGWHFKEALDRSDSAGHEIATHGWSHLPLASVRDPTSAVALELNRVEAWAKERNFQVRTMVFPRNQVAAAHLLPSHGISAYRAAPRPFAPRLGRVGSLLREIAVWEKSAPPSSNLAGPIEIPGDFFLNWRAGGRLLVPPRLTLIRWRHILTHAARTGGLAHLWLHPHNLITGRNQVELLDACCAEIARFTRNGDLLVRTQTQLDGNH